MFCFFNGTSFKIQGAIMCLKIILSTLVITALNAQGMANNVSELKLSQNERREIQSLIRAHNSHIIFAKIYNRKNPIAIDKSIVDYAEEQCEKFAHNHDAITSMHRWSIASMLACAYYSQMHDAMRRPDTHNNDCCGICI